MSRAPFNPENPFDACADAVRRGVAGVAQAAAGLDAFRSLSREDQVVCMTAGLMTGAVGVMLAFLDPAGHDEFMQALADYLPEARANACDIIQNGERRSHDAPRH